jgi:sigma-E factor negative regulatory protein RseA
MKHDISSLMDGELGTVESSRAIDALRRDRQLQTTWHAYHLLGDTLRQSPGGSLRFTENVMSRLEAEPVVLAPVTKRPAAATPIRFALPLAAALAGMGAVGWVALSLNPVQPVELAAAPAGHKETQQANPPAQMAAGGLKEYLMAHQAHSTNKGIPGVAPYVRTVSDIRQGTKP